METNNLDELIEVMVFSFLCKVGSIIVGTLFPCFSTYKAAKRRDGPMQKFYGKYWTIFGCLSSIETIADALYLTSLIPGYQMMKFVFLLWTSTGGASFVYDNVVFPLMKKHEKQIDEVVSSTGQFALKAAGNLFSKALSSALTSMAKIPTATTPIIASTFFGAPTSQSVSRVPVQQATPSHLHRQVLRSLSVEETFQPGASYSARVVEIEEMDDEGWPSRDMPGPSRSQRPMDDFETVVQMSHRQKANNEEAPPRRSRRQAKINANLRSVIALDSGNEDNLSDQNVQQDNEFVTTDDEAPRSKMRRKKNESRGGKGRGRAGRNTTSNRGTDSF